MSDSSSVLALPDEDPSDLDFVPVNVTEESLSTTIGDITDGSLCTTSQETHIDSLGKEAKGWYCLLVFIISLFSFNHHCTPQ